MKMTKTIREFITTTVTEKYANVVLNIELGANRQELMEMLDNIVVD